MPLNSELVLQLPKPNDNTGSWDIYQKPLLIQLTADRAKGDFISNVSHELRSPLHGILASVEFLADSEQNLSLRPSRTASSFRREHPFIYIPKNLSTNSSSSSRRISEKSCRHR